MGVRRRGVRRSQKATSDEVATASVTAGRGTARSASGLKPDEGEVLAAIESLYVDQLKPFGRILRKRLAERAAPAIAAAQLRREAEGPKQARASDSRRSSKSSSGGSQVSGKANSLPDIDVKHLKDVCDACTRLHVEPEEGGDWSAAFAGRVDPFVDIYSNVDSYSEEFWTQAMEHFGILGREEMLLPGGRYSCAQMLMTRHLPFLVNLTLGQVCHFVQLAISQRKVLGYLDGSVVPYQFSQSMVKEQAAAQQVATAAVSQEGAPGSGMTFATWDVARACMREILESAAVPEQQGPPTVPLSSVKRLLRSRYQVELSETALGHSKLSELLQDEKIRSVCSVELHGQGYIVVLNEDAVGRASVPAVAEALSEAREGQPESSDAEDGAIERAPRRVSFCPDEPLELEEEGFFEEDGDWIPPAFSSSSTNTPLPSPGVPPSATVRKWRGESQKGPEKHAAGQYDLGQALAAFSPDASDSSWSASEPRRVVFCPGEPLNLEEEGFSWGLPALELATPEPSPGVPSSSTLRRWPQAMPRPAGSQEFAPLAPSLQLTSTPLPSPGVPTSTTARRWRQHVSHLAPGAADNNLQPLAVSRSVSATSSVSSAKSPGVNWQVHNTFIHTAAAPPTPLPGARRRAVSVPKDLGTAVAPISPTSSAGKPPSPTMAEGTPVKVQLNRLESLGSLGNVSEVDRTPRSRPLFCPDEPLCFDEAGIFLDAEQLPASPARRPGSSPTKGQPSGWVVQNTFIQLTAPPLTPAPGAKPRSRSVPKDVGSESRPCVTPRPPAPPRCTLPLRKVSQESVDFELSAPTPTGFDADPVFVPRSPAVGMLPPTPQTPFYNHGGSGIAAGSPWTFPTKVRSAADQSQSQRILRLSDYL